MEQHRGVDGRGDAEKSSLRIEEFRTEGLRD
jgi:hypothetical protein